MLFFGGWIVSTGGGFVTDKGVVDGLLKLAVFTESKFDEGFVMVDDLPLASHLLLQKFHAVLQGFELSAVGVRHLGTTILYQQRAFAGEKVVEIECARESSTYTFEQAVG